jgi:hypothetical protein
MTVAQIAKTLAELTNIPDPDTTFIMDCIDRMVATEAEDAKDALALLASARKILNATASPPDTVEGLAQHAALLLIRNAIRALEKLSGEREATYAGHEWN